MKTILKEREYDTTKGLQWSIEYNNLLDRANKRLKELTKIISEYDLQEQDILHYIEMKKFDAVMGSMLMKKLKEITMNRRTAKEEFSALTSITQLSKKTKYKNNETYTFKSNVIVNIMEQIKASGQIGKDVNS